MEECTGQIAILIDPEKVVFDDAFHHFIRTIENSGVSYLFVGGSTVTAEQQHACIQAIRALTTLPVIIFPGSHEQINKHADAILFLNLISGRNPEFLIGHHVAAVPRLLDSDLEIIPTAYLLIDGGHETTVQRISQTQAIELNHFEVALHTALAGVMMGNDVVYLDAGSGAKNAIPTTWIRELKQHIAQPIIVGGGIRSVAQIQDFFDAGANIVVIGNHVESNPEFLGELSALLTKSRV